MKSDGRAELVLVRHGETAWSISGQHTGLTDIPLTDAGREQARSLAARLSERPYARVLTSPLGRAVETCRLAGFGDRAETRDELLEWDYGDYEGRTTPDVRTERPDWLLWRDGCPNGEGPADVGARVDRLIAELREGEGDAVLFAHGHVLRVLAARWIELGPEVGGRLTLSPAAVSILGWDRERAAIRVWNEVSQA